MEVVIAILIALVFVIIVLALATAAIASAYNLVFEKYNALRYKRNKEEKKFLGADRLIAEERQVLKQKFDELVANESTNFHQILEEFKVEALKVLNETGQGAKNEIRGDLANFRKELGSHMTDELAKTRAEMENYKKEKKKELDSKAKMVLKEVAMQVLPDAIDVDKHDDLIIKSLEEAKSRNFFN